MDCGQRLLGHHDCPNEREGIEPPATFPLTTTNTARSVEEASITEGTDRRTYPWRPPFLFGRHESRIFS